MKVIEHLARAAEPPVSFEIIPPKRGGNLSSLLQLIGELAVFKPPFIDITSHPAEIMQIRTDNGSERRWVRRRPGTLGVCALVQHQFGIDAVPHVLCHSFSRQETEDFLIELRYLRIDNLLALRGDERPEPKALGMGRHGNAHAVDLVQQVAAMNEGHYLDGSPDVEASDFCIGVAGYPECHVDAPDLATDIAHAKAKVDAGAAYIVTQMFFDNQHYFNYVRACRAAGITAPIIPGLKMLRSVKQLSAIPKAFACAIPEALCHAITRAASPEAAAAEGLRWCAMQAQGLLEGGAPALHFYVMQSAAWVPEVMARLKR